MRDKEAARDSAKDAVKITNQCRVRGGMAYGVKCAGVQLTITVSPRTTPDDLDEWHVEARAGSAGQEPVTISEWGPTRLEALRAVGRSWPARASVLDTALFDWEAVARVLQEVKAL
jgi:hypothetical protein